VTEINYSERAVEWLEDAEYDTQERIVKKVGSIVTFLSIILNPLLTVRTTVSVSVAIARLSTGTRKPTNCSSVVSENVKAFTISGYHDVDTSHEMGVSRRFRAFANAIATATEFGDETAFRERIVGVGAEKSFGCVLEYLLPTDRVAHAATPSEWSKLLSICLV